MTNADIVGQLLPNVYISKIVLESTNDDKLQANLQFVIKENMANDDISSWLEDSDVLKYLKIFVIQSSEQRLTQLIQGLMEASYVSASSDSQMTLGNYQSELINILETTDPSFANDALRQLKLGLYDEESFRLFKTYLRDNYTSTFQNIEQSLTYKSVNLSEQLSSLRDLLASGRAQRTEEPDGTRTYNIFIDLNFSAEESGLGENPVELSYIFGSIVDLASIIRDNTDIAYISNDINANVDFSVSNIQIENVITSGRVSSTASLFIDNRDIPWPGKVHTIIRMNSQGAQTIVFRSGESESENSVDLRRIEVPNNKVQDFRQLRNLTEIQTLDNDFIKTDLEVFDNLNLIGQNLDNSSAISDAFISTDEFGYSSVSFFIDFKKMFMQNSVHGHALMSLKTDNSKAFINSFYAMCSIEKIILKCKRIDLDTSLAAYKSNEVVIKEYYTNNIPSIERRVSLDGPAAQTTQLRLFSIPDMIQKEPGVYEYSLEIGYKDGVQEQIQGMIDNLNKEYRAFLYYYNFCNTPDIFNETIQRFKNESLEEFTYFDELAQVSGTIDDITDFSVSGVTYKAVLNQIYNHSTTETVNVVNSWLDRINGTPKSVSYVLKLYDNLIKQLGKTVVTTPFVNNSLNEKNGSPVQDTYSSTRLNSIVIKKTFNNLLDLTPPYRFEYLNHTKRELGRSVTVDSDPFIYEIIKTELVEKKLRNSFSQNYIKNPGTYRKDFYDRIGNLFGDLTNLKISRHIELSQEAVNTLSRRELPNFFERYDPSSLQQLGQSVLDTSVTDQLEIDAINRLYLTLLGPTISSDNEYTDFIIDSSNKENIFWSIRPNSAVVSGREISGLFAGCTIDKDDINKMPNQLKSLLRKKTTTLTTIGTMASMGDAEIRLKYELIKSIVHLIGFQYDSQNGIFNLQEEYWMKLTNVRDASFVNGAPLFCKLKDYDNQYIKYKFNKTLKSGVTNEYFFLTNNVDDNGRIVNGATNMSKDMYNSRCLIETKAFFDGEEEPSVDVVLGGSVMNRLDSVSKNKYSFLSPYGFYMDNNFKTINPFHMEQLPASPVTSIPINNRYIGFVPDYTRSRSFRTNVRRTLAASLHSFNLPLGGLLR